MYSIYNLGAQSHVSVSFESPEYTANCDALGMFASSMLEVNYMLTGYQLIIVKPMDYSHA